MQSQLEALKNLQGSVAWTHDSKGLASFRSAVSATVSATQTFVQQSSQASGKEFVAGALYAASTASRLAVSDFTKAYYEQRIFEPYLKFASAEDEEAYQRREAEHLLAIEKAKGEGTPQGDLRAAQHSLEQLEDAGAHGANRSPEYQSRREKLTLATNQLATALQKPAKQMAESVSDPLDAAKPAGVSPELLESIRASGMALTEQGVEGHGVNQAMPKSEQKVRN